jgi:NADH-quinone oxidoreductase subunit A
VIHIWPLIVYGAAVLAVVVGMLALSAVLGQRHREGATDKTYESGIVSTGSAQVRFDAKFYLMAMFFVIFDLEAVFIFAYALAFRASGWIGYIEIFVFIGILMAALIYLWRLGALDWGTRRHRTTAKR